MKKNSAFTLIELSVSLAIIALLVSIVVQSIKLTSTAKLTTARSITSNSPVPNIPGLLAWYETSSIDSLQTSEAIDGKQISTWYDISPDSLTEKKNTLTRTASSAVTYVAKGIGNIPSINFSTTNGTPILSLAEFYQGRSSQNTVFVVARPTTVSGTTGALFDSSASNNVSVGVLYPTIVQLYAGNAINIPQNILAGKSYITAFYFNSTNSKVYLNDASTMLGGSTFDAGSNPLIGFTIGTDRGGNWGIQGMISEVIVYNRPLKDIERKDVMRYLSKKYDIQITGL